MNEMTTASRAEPAVVVNEDEQPRRTDLPLGIYFSLPESDYFADIACGSSDMKRLATSPPDWYWQSRYNALWEPEDPTDALIKGKAAHTIILEGRDKFERLYGRKTLSFATTDGKKQRDAFAAAGKTPLAAEDYDRLLVIGAIIRSNPHIAQAFDGAVGHEVSVFWERGGIKRKARFDCLKPRAIVDLKNISNDRGLSFQQAALRYIDNYSAHVQAEHYREARLAMRGLLSRGLVYGDHDAEALAEAAAATEHAFVFIFAQSSGAPLTWATMLSFKERREWADEDGEVHTEDEIINEMFVHGRTMLDRAEKNWHAYKSRFGLDTPWLLLEPIQELDVSDLPPWFARNAELASK
ncbi:MAG: PD-(D/E)XK nuclease-like domain-containing protein [Hyphomicrobiales bacterium]|nr:PD-(D/E)XK nuclease-like domain-containing protein [Hyphomicrobiales bacterium]MBV8662356.1 PD-(D/E)XK nuclease-like domain-containing protein [Hyphomicrobiales bacterium]